MTVPTWGQLARRAWDVTRSWLRPAHMCPMCDSGCAKLIANGEPQGWLGALFFSLPWRCLECDWKEVPTVRVSPEQTPPPRPITGLSPTPSGRCYGSKSGPGAFNAFTPHNEIKVAREKLNQAVALEWGDLPAGELQPGEFGQRLHTRPHIVADGVDVVAWGKVLLPGQVAFNPHTQELETWDGKHPAAPAVRRNGGYRWAIEDPNGMGEMW